MTTQEAIFVEAEDVITLDDVNTPLPSLEHVLPSEPATTVYTDGSGKKYKLIVNDQGRLTRVKLR